MGDRHPLDHAVLGGADLERLRAQFPVLAQTINGAPLAYLDNAATTQSPLSVQDAVRHFEQHDRANIHRGVHTLSQRATVPSNRRSTSSASSARVRRTN
jgi:cysteine desulfurase/selenocysteine lyase